MIGAERAEIAERADAEPAAAGRATTECPAAGAAVLCERVELASES